MEFQGKKLINKVMISPTERWVQLFELYPNGIPN